VFRKRPKNVSYVLIAVLVIVIFLSQTSVFNSLKFQLVQSLSIPLKLLKFPLTEAKKILFYHRTFDEYRKYEKEADILNAKMIGMQELIKENLRLEELLKFKRKLVYPSIAATVIGRDPTLWNSTMIINRGEDQGIREGMPVVNAWGVVGKIVEVGNQYSKVMLLTDPQFSIAALVQRPRESGVVAGTLQGMCRLRYINENAKIEVGDKVITSPLSSHFPDGLMIGEITAVRESPNEPYPECTIKPSVSISQLEEVLVIINEEEAGK